MLDAWTSGPFGVDLVGVGSLAEDVVAVGFVAVDFVGVGFSPASVGVGFS